MSDLIERLRRPVTRINAEVALLAEAAGTAADEIERLTAELETERMRLVACGVAALANTADSAARARDIRPEHRSASLDDVERAVDREIQLRDERDELRRQLAEAGESIARQAATIARMRGALTESYQVIVTDRASLHMTSANPDGTIDHEDDRAALAEYDDVLSVISAALADES